MRLAWGSVVAIERPGAAQRLRVVVDDRAGDAFAICYAALTGPCAVGDRVLLNTVAVDLDLGTGGDHFVAARVTASDGEPYDALSGGHVLKLRYTPLQADVIAVEERSSPHYDVMSRELGLDGMPVVCCALHSQVPVVAASVAGIAPRPLKVAYLMTDQAALPLALSDVVRESVAAGLVHSTISCGQAFGGMLEAVNLYSGLVAAKHVVEADVAIVGIGPGIVGTATPLGHGGISQGEAINAVGGLGGEPIAALRVSFADSRERHIGVSHHSLTALKVVALASALVAVPELPLEQQRVVDDMLEHAGVWTRHRRAATLGDVESLELRGMDVRTMGRSAADDPAYFAAAAAAGEVAVRVVTEGTYVE